MAILCILLSLANILLLLYIILSFVPRPPEPILPLARGVRRLVDPALAPLRRLLPPLAVGRVGLDLSVIVVFLVINLLQGAFGCGLLS
ncbi:MAG TPA: YggT family protein [Solirubrobacteraceae bacterium]|nr:YggT family protein [Solirubrobacteraceae bacterium]